LGKFQNNLNNQLPRAERDKPPPRRKRPYSTGIGLKVIIHR
jgi:hypothetical protein